MLTAEASEHTLGRQVFWLPAPAPPLGWGHGPERPSRGPGGSQWRGEIRSLAGYSGGPATDSHRFPYCPRGRHSAGGTSSRPEAIGCMGCAAAASSRHAAEIGGASRRARLAHYHGVRRISAREADRMTVAVFTLAELEKVLSAADPAALLVPPRILRRVIKKHSGLTGPGLQVPHRQKLRHRPRGAAGRRRPGGPRPQTGPRIAGNAAALSRAGPAQAAAAPAGGDAAQVLATPLPRTRPPGRRPQPAGRPRRRRDHPRAHPPHRPGRGRRGPHRPPPGKLPAPLAQSAVRL